MPVELTAGPDENNAELVLLSMRKDTLWPLSSAGPGTMFVAQPETDWAPASSRST